MNDLIKKIIGAMKIGHARPTRQEFRDTEGEQPVVIALREKGIPYFAVTDKNGKQDDALNYELPLNDRTEKLMYNQVARTLDIEACGITFDKQSVIALLELVKDMPDEIKFMTIPDALYLEHPRDGTMYIESDAKYGALLIQHGDNIIAMYGNRVLIKPKHKLRITPEDEGWDIPIDAQKQSLVDYNKIDTELFGSQDSPEANPTTSDDIINEVELLLWDSDNEIDSLFA